jgi:hypothetical protein
MLTILTPEVIAKLNYLVLVSLKDELSFLLLDISELTNNNDEIEIIEYEVNRNLNNILEGISKFEKQPIEKTIVGNICLN